MGAQDLDTSWRYGVFEADFFFELASRARVASVVRDELAHGKIVLCKNFTLASAVHVRLDRARLGGGGAERPGAAGARASLRTRGRSRPHDLRGHAPRGGLQAAGRTPLRVLPGRDARAPAGALPPGARPAAARIGRRSSRPARRMASSRNRWRRSVPSPGDGARAGGAIRPSPAETYPADPCTRSRHGCRTTRPQARPGRPWRSASRGAALRLRPSSPGPGPGCGSARRSGCS